MARIKPWRRKPKVKNLAGSLNTSMTFAVVGSPEKFTEKFHAYKVYQVLKQLGAKVLLISPGLEEVEKERVYPDLMSLPEKVDAVIPCLPAKYSLSIVKEADEAGIKRVWFQYRTKSKDAEQYCLENEMEIVDGCVLMYREYQDIFKITNPCFWHFKTAERKKKYL